MQERVYQARLVFKQTDDLIANQHLRLVNGLPMRLGEMVERARIRHEVADVL